MHGREGGAQSTRDGPRDLVATLAAALAQGHHGATCLQYDLGGVREVIRIVLISMADKLIHVETLVQRANRRRNIH
jgi:hypothetical protein